MMKGVILTYDEEELFRKWFVSMAKKVKPVVEMKFEDNEAMNRWRRVFKAEKLDKKLN